jgi:hypothetical protein
LNASAINSTPLAWWIDEMMMLLLSTVLNGPMGQQVWQDYTHNFDFSTSSYIFSTKLEK